MRQERGRFVNYIKGGPEQNWCLAYFRADKPANSKLITVYASKNVPELNVFYEVDLDQQNTGTYKLVNLKQVQPENQKDIKKILTKLGVNKISVKVICEKYDDDFDTFERKVFEGDSELITILSEAKFSELRISLQCLKEDDLFEKTGLLALATKIRKKVLNNENSLLSIELQKINIYMLFIKYKIQFDEIESLITVLQLPFKLVQRNCALIFKVIDERLKRDNSTLFFMNEIIRDCNMSENDFAEALNLGIKEEVFALVEKEFARDNNQKVNLTMITTKEILEMEEYVAYRINKLNLNKISNLSYQESEILDLDEDQKKAFVSSVQESMAIISGSPGSGKTHVIGKIFSNLTKQGFKDNQDLMILAPTGRAASNISMKIGAVAKTIHSFLKIDTDDAAIDFDNPVFKDLKVLIIDEFSMVNLRIFYLLLSACQNLEKVILVGDANQLQAIGNGNLLQDILTSETIKQIFLKTNHRSEYEEIPEFFKTIIDQKDTYDFTKSDNVVFKDVPLEDFVTEVAAEYIEKIKEYGSDNVMALVPMYKNAYGIDEINKIIQNKINPKGKVVLEKKVFDTTIDFRVRDRVIQTENDYEKNVFNGDIGVIQDFYKDSSDKKIKIIVRFEPNHLSSGEPRVLSYTEAAFKKQINLAYAISVHKFQGSEADCIIFGMIKPHDFMLTKRLVYTATSRAKKKLIIIGDYQYFKDKTYRNINQENPIFTRLEDLIE
ncbi:ATP-dependent RecD-like DNA helicase [Mycoplasma sp. Ms02]|uniref:ATP-dependent DNA helicase n=1 Tax=Mycoplasma sp. Ms02 TaxID=353851 RepID=UPI001C892546|nr:AAA family ATPase [Mycoplasma sp. Ms02]QZE12107.1 AAA family ATPase [Mycoplasma sp. Ms02]